MEQRDSEERLVGADRVLAVLVELADHPSGVTLEELAQKMRSPKSTVHRALVTLRWARLATQTGRGVYVLGGRVPAARIPAPRRPARVGTPRTGSA